MESEEKLCVKVLRTLQQMLLKKTKYGDRVSALEGWVPGGPGHGGLRARPTWLDGKGGDGLPWALLPSLQGNQLRKMLLQNYLQNRKSSSRGDLPDPMGTGQSCVPPARPLGSQFTPGLSFPSLHAPPYVTFLPPGLDQDWSAIAATQCRLDKEGATKLVCDLITSTKNEKIFQESIGLAIRLLDGGNTEIQVCQSLRPCGRASSPRGQCQSNYSAALPPVSALCHVALFHPTPLRCSILAWACCPPSLPQLCPPFLPRSLCSGLLPALPHAP